jgi:hypothetical protein
MTTGITARDRIHVKNCNDEHCRVEGEPGERCKNLDFLLDQAEAEARANYLATDSKRTV